MGSYVFIVHTSRADVHNPGETTTHSSEGQQAMKHKIVLIAKVAGTVILATFMVFVLKMMVTISVPPCEFEDGSLVSVCVWDAQQRGNGEGRSFLSAP